MLPVVSLQLNYKKPAFYDELITIRTKLKNITSSKIEFDYELINENEEVISTANTTLVFVDKKTWRPTRCPEKIIRLIESQTKN